MGAKIDWRGDQWAQAFRGEMKRRTSAAAIRLKSQIQADISQPGTLRYSPATKAGKASKSQKTIYNFTHSRPGNSPYKQTGHLRRSMAWELIDKGGHTFVGRVGTNLKYGRYLELGTRRMKARPYLRPGLRKFGPELRSIMLRKVPVGGLPGVFSNQSRFGILGAGARRAGYA